MFKTSFPQVDLKRILSIEQMPAMPQSAVRLLELSRDPQTGAREFAIPIESDPGLAAQVLRFVNSSYFGFRSKICSVKQAITLTGIRTIKNFALWSAVFSLIPNPKCGPFDLKRLWQDSLRRALFARQMAVLLRLPDAEEVFSAALLQDMAVPMLAREAPEAYRTLFGAGGNKNSQVRLSALEQHVFGWTHAKAAGIMVRNWGLPEGFAVLIESHLAIDALANQSPVDPGRLAVALSAMLPTTGEQGWTESGVFERTYRKVCPGQEPSIAELFARVDHEFAEFAPLLKLPSPKRSLVDSYEAVATAAG
jgi:HD-like signal output (HDOD) protein